MRRELVFRVQDLPKDADVIWKLSPTGASANGEVVLNGQESPPGYYSKIFAVRSDNRALDLRVGVATGAWRTVTDWDPSGNIALGLTGGYSLVAETFVGKHGTSIVVSHTFRNSNCRIMAIDTQGNIHKSTGSSVHSAGPVASLSTWNFGDLALEKIKRFEFQARDYEWVEIEGLPVTPNKNNEAPIVAATKVKVPATISGRIVLEDGSPATVKGWMYYNAKRKGNSSIGLDGQYTDSYSCKAPAGTIWLSYFPKGFAPAWVGPFEMRPGERLEGITIVLKPGFSELVRVTNERGEPVAGATIVAHPEINGQANGPVHEKTTDEKGEYLLTHLADTRYTLTITAQGYQPLRTAPLRLEPGEVLRPTMIRSKPNTGVVRFADGTPAPGTKLYCTSEIRKDGENFHYGGGYGKLFATCDDSEIESMGRFSLDQLADGSHYLFVVEAVDGARGIVSDLQAGQEDVQIVLPQRCDLFVKIIGDLSNLPKRHGKPFVSVR